MALALLAFFATTSAASADPPDRWVTSARDVPSHDDNAAAKKLDEDRYVILPAGEDATALKLLARHKMVALDCATYAKIRPSAPCPHDADRKPYLARAVDLQQSLGSIHVLQDGGDIAMDYNGPIESGSIRHRAVILYLPAPPKHLIVSITLYS